MAINYRVRFEVFKRDSFHCQYCGRRAPHVAIEVEHVRPVSLGGTNDMWNLVTACRECNSGKSNVPLSIEQIRKIDGHVPNLIAQMVCYCDEPGVIDRIIAISTHGRLFGDWLSDLEKLFDRLHAEWNAINIAGGDTE